MCLTGVDQANHPCGRNGEMTNRLDLNQANFRQNSDVVRMMSI